MKLIIDIPVELAEKEHWYTDKEMWTVIKAAQNGTQLEQIRAEIDGIEITGQIDEHTSFIRTGDSVKKIVLEILDKYR